MRYFVAVFFTLCLLGCGGPSTSVAQQALAAQAASQTVVFMGDSLTAWWPLATSFPGAPFTDKGIPGNTTAQMLARFDADVIQLHPDTVIIWGGQNDIGYGLSLDDAKQNIIAMDQAAAQAGIRVVLGTVTPRCCYDDAAAINATVVDFNTWLRSYAALNGHPIADYYYAVVAPDGSLRQDFAKDFVHFNAAGYAAVTPVANAALALTATVSH